MTEDAPVASAAMDQLSVMLDDARSAQRRVVAALAVLDADSPEAIILHLVDRKYDTIIIELRGVLAAAQNGDVRAPQPVDHQALHHHH